MELTKTSAFIAELRTEAGLTQQQLADALGVTDKAVSRWETGRGFPDVSILEDLADALGCSVAELLRGERLPAQADAALADETARSTLALARELIGTRRIRQLAVGILIGAAIACIAFVHLTSPIMIAGAAGTLELDETAGPRVIAVMDDDVAGYYLARLPSEDGTGTEVFISCYSTLWHRLTRAEGATLADLGPAEELDRVYYYPSRQPTGDDELIYARPGAEPSGGVVTLPRLIYNQWIFIGTLACFVLACAIGWAKLRRASARRQEILVRSALVPASLTLATVAVLAGHMHEVYNAAHYITGILLLAPIVYALLFAALRALGRREPAKLV